MIVFWIMRESAFLYE